MHTMKVRGRRKDNGKWVYGWLLKLLDGSSIIVLEAARTTETHSHYPAISLGIYHEVIPKTVGQFTTRFDKNGKEIYRGSIMNFLADKGSPSGGYYAGTVGFHPENARVVEWDKDCWMVGGFRLSTQLRMYEVIGNVHDNEKESNANN